MNDAHGDPLKSGVSDAWMRDACEVTGEARKLLIGDIAERSYNAKPRADEAAWEKNWNEQKIRFMQTESEDALVPTFIRNAPVRFRDKLYNGDRSELLYVCAVQDWLAAVFQKYATGAIYEYGAGSGFNLVSLARRLSGFHFFGFDLSNNALDLILLAALTLDLPIGADYFDMRSPRGVAIPKGAGVLTFGAMEQLGERFEWFITYLVAQEPAIVVHIEPIPELLGDSLLDCLSLEFHKRRGYTRGILPYLQGHPEVELLHAERSHFGSLMLESYARIAWRVRS